MKTKASETARDRNLLVCLECDLLMRGCLSPFCSCPRCAAPVSPRKPHSLARTTALATAAAALYLPANLLPMMTTTSLTGVRQDTILSGIVALWTSGSWGIAGIVFIASIIVPLLKLCALALLLGHTRRPGTLHPLWLARMYRLLRGVGRWSMLDIYVIALLSKLVQSPLTARIEVGPAALPFGAVVVLTMLAVQHFDPRLIWDSLGKRVSHV